MGNIVDSRHLAISEAELTERERTDPETGTISARALWTDGGQTHGIWQMTPGVLRDVQGPESVAIVAGRARVTVHPSEEVYEIGAGDTFILDAGETATWQVLETVRKFYVINR
ncbi:cupin domain-containing protein [Gordonia aurantiaca]|uniref:cupin domain-containing protein n=1 Tax=Gordonia sp. B21 TaxID=3151852 RepID=UPI0032642FB6